MQLKSQLKVALVGDFNESVVAHQLIPAALRIAGSHNKLMVEPVWIPTAKLPDLDRNWPTSLDGIWCVPGSPYQNGKAVLETIRYARESGKPYLGTCGGCQHAVLEFAINKLGLRNTGLEEEDPSAEIPLISALPCQMIDENRKILLSKGSRIHELIGKVEISEEYRCGFGVNPLYLHLFENTDLKFVGFNEDNIPQAL